MMANTIIHNNKQKIKHISSCYVNMCVVLIRERRVFSGMVAALDEAVGNITKALRETGHSENTIIGQKKKGFIIILIPFLYFCLNSSPLINCL